MARTGIGNFQFVFGG